MERKQVKKIEVEYSDGTIEEIESPGMRHDMDRFFEKGAKSHTEAKERHTIVWTVDPNQGDN